MIYEKSNCCGKKIEIVSGEEGTNFYVCLACHKPCDAQGESAPTQKQGVPELIRDQIDSVFSAGLEFMAKHNLGNEWAQTKKKEATDAIIELIDRDVIGEDDELFVISPSKGSCRRAGYAEIRNQLRAEQRAKLKGTNE